ncbi:hypothetical protein JOM56_000918 [Amanita muscaria]
MTDHLLGIELRLLWSLGTISCTCLKDDDRIFFFCVVFGTLAYSLLYISLYQLKGNVVKGSVPWLSDTKPYQT